ncbi:flavodoxin domain-containing protein [Thermodesulfobacteriota bacterium]
MKEMNRREFIVDGTLMLGGAVGCMALGGNLLAPDDANAASINFPESSCRPEKKNDKKVLVAYASLCGTTGGVAEAIGKVLCDRGASVDVRYLKKVNDIEQYDAFIIGSATRSASWWPEAIEYVKKNKNELSRRPVAYFLTCLALQKDNKNSRKVARGYMDAVLESVPEVNPVDIGLFAGVLDYSKLNLIYRMVMKSKMKKKGVPEGDFRNWDAIRKWAEGICDPLLGA